MKRNLYLKNQKKRTKSNSGESNLIGYTDTDPEGYWADAAWVPIRYYAEGAPKVFNATSLQHVVTSKKYYAQMTLGETLKTQGYAGGSRSGDIIAKGTYYKASWGHDLYQQVVYDNAIEGGDSGSPVYTESWSSGQYNVKAYGINWGRWVDLDRTVFSPMSGIESDLGSAFDVTG